LTANHLCPECGLRFDERCALYRVANPRQLLRRLLLISAFLCVSVWGSLMNLPRIWNLENQSTLGKFSTVLSVVFLFCFVVLIWSFVKRYRRGFEVAITTDGLILRLPSFSYDLISWNDIGAVSVKELPEEKPQVAIVVIKSKKRLVPIGGMANVFPKRADVERFVRQVQERIESPNSIERTESELAG
jgi:hypothetical protein